MTNTLAYKAFNANMTCRDFAAGEGGALVASWTDPAGRLRLVLGYVGEDGIKPNTWYRAAAGKLVEIGPVE